MDLMIDANIAIDVFTKREPFFDSARQVFALCMQDGFRGMFWTGEITTIHYILSKPLGKEAARGHIRTMLELFDVLDVTREDMLDAEESGMPDYEDAVIAYCAKRANADYIITRNVNDFEGSPVPALSPEDFLKDYYGQ